LVAFEYAVASDHYYQLLKNHERAIFRVVFANGEERSSESCTWTRSNEDFIYDLVSTNLERDVDRPASGAAYVSKFADLMSARLEEVMCLSGSW